MGDSMKIRRAAGLIVPALLAAACRRDAPAPKEEAAPAAATPVRVASVATADIDRIVSASGHTVALAQQKVRPPFAGVLTELRVADGDRVRRGETLGSVVSKDSQAALDGAREMVREAHGAAEKEDAGRALALAEKNLVRATLKSPADGPVVSHTANAGDRVTEDQEIVTISAEDSIVFQADVPQSDLARVRPGESASIELAGSPSPIPGSVHDILPAANAADQTAPVRIDLRRPEAPLPVGLFGTARLRVERHTGATVVPASALLRDDVTGKSRVAVVEAGPGGAARARWREVTTGLEQDGRVEILAPPLPAGTRVVVEGQVGLAEGAAVSARP
jgi:RND family efflux transporter MFP subunit